jgi:hypothetical protein
MKLYSSHCAEASGTVTFMHMPKKCSVLNGTRRSMTVLIKANLCTLSWAIRYTICRTEVVDSFTFPWRCRCCLHTNPSAHAVPRTESSTFRPPQNWAYKTDSVAFSPKANYTDWATATCQRNVMPTFVDRGVSRGQRGGSPRSLISVF